MMRPSAPRARLRARSTTSTASSIRPRRPDRHRRLRQDLSRSARGALTVLGLDQADLRRYGIRLLKLGMIYPRRSRDRAPFADGLDEIIVVEEKRAFLETAVRTSSTGAPTPRWSSARPTRTAVAGQFGRRARRRPGRHCAWPADWATSIDIEPVQRVAAAAQRRSRIALPLLTRTPYFCSGCPHNSSTKVAPDSARRRRNRLPRHGD